MSTCGDGLCDFFFTFRSIGRKNEHMIEMELYAKLNSDEKYVAVGFSSDIMMV